MDGLVPPLNRNGVVSRPLDTIEHCAIEIVVEDLSFA
jgi:hypothetical protein